MGMDGMQIIILFAAVMVSFMVSYFLTILIIFAAIVILTFVNREIKKGNPSPIESYFLKEKMKRKVVDNDNVLKIIYKNGINESTELE